MLSKIKFKNKKCFLETYLPYKKNDSFPKMYFFSNKQKNNKVNVVTFFSKVFPRIGVVCVSLFKAHFPLNTLYAYICL